MKSAWKTTEFWFKIGVALVGLVVSLGLLNADQAKEYEDKWAEIVNKVFDLAPLLLPAWMAIMHGKRRTELKRTDTAAMAKSGLRITKDS